ncbi:carbohydrate kinase family protein [Patescibacteria group bacterium]|nr:MAG: carbohydrate kinase family protein [Patescibacteria group bacterium]
MSKPVFDMISVGDATLDIFIFVSEASVMCSVDRTACLLCFNYADKIPIERLDRSVAGNAANNAVGSARLGLNTSFYSIIGDDETGHSVTETMKKEKVSLEHLRLDKKHPSNYSVVLNYRGERTILTHSEPRTYEAPHLVHSEWVYYTAIGKNHERLERDIVKHVKRTDTKLAYNPGSSQLREGLKRLLPTFAATNVLFLNKEEAQLLVGKQGTMSALLRALQEQGPEMVVVTDGPRGSSVFDGRKMYSMGVFPVKVVEMTGAGDAFATAFIAALHYGRPVTEALRWGAANAASVVTKIGPQAGLLRLPELKRWLKRYASVKPRELKTG